VSAEALVVASMTELCEQSVTKRLIEVVAANPDALAVASERERLTYAELDLASRRVAAALSERLEGERQVVGVALKRDLPALVAMFGAMRAGHIALVLDPRHPLEAMATAAGVAAIVVDSEFLTPNLACPAWVYTELVSANPGSDVESEAGETARLAYTSGSEGAPKGIAQSHRTVLHSALNLAAGLELGPGGQLWQPSALSFGAAMAWSMAALMSGATLRLGEIADVGLLPLTDGLAQQDRVDLALVPSVFRELVSIATPAQLSGVRNVILGGERLLPTDLEKGWRVAPQIRFINNLGSSEGATVAWAAFRQTTLGPDLPMHPFPDKKLQIVEADGAPTAPGVVGELTVCSRYLSAGYWRRPDLTNAVFSDGPDGTCILRTGDHGWLDDEGRLHFVGRRDDQVKVRGQKVQLGAVETVFAGLAGVREAAVTSAERDGRTSLFAQVVPQATNLDVIELRSRLADVLPPAAIPSSIRIVDRLPTLPNGKLDRRALARAVEISKSPGLASGLEARLLEIWEEVLEHRPIGRDDDFFELGGDSLGAMEMLAEIEFRLGPRLTPSVLVDAATIATLAELIDIPDPTGVPGHATGSRGPSGVRPIFVLYPLSGSALRYRPLAEALGSEVPLQFLEAPWWDGRRSRIRTVEQLATHHLSEIRRLQASGPYMLAGYSFGGLLAFELARQLAAAGQEVALLAVIDISAGAKRGPDEEDEPAGARLRRRRSSSILKLRWRLEQARFGSVRTERWRYVRTLTFTAGKAYQPGPYDGPVVLLRCTQTPGPADHGWSSVALGGVEVHDFECNHREIVRPPWVQEVAELLGQRAAEVRGVVFGGQTR